MANAEHGGPGGAFGTSPGTKMAAVRVGLWLIAAALAVRQVAAVLTTPRGERLTDLETWIGENGVLHVRGSFYDTDTFTGTPLAGLVLRPLTRSAEQALGVGWTFGTLLLVVALGIVAARSLPSPVSRRTALLAAPVAVSLLILSLPVRNTLDLGQTSIIPVLLVLVGCLAARGERTSGVLIGVAAALQPTVLLFAPLLWLTGRKRAAVSTGVTFAACTALAWAAMPKDSWTFWVHHFAGTGLGDRPDGVGNQSLHGALLRLGLEGTAEKALFFALGAAVVYVGLRRAVRYARDGQLLLAVAVTGCVSAVVSPTAWQHQLLWVLLAVVGRVGKRRSDRLVWPVAVVIVMTLPAKMMLPNMSALYPVRDNALLIAALAAACVVPFVLRTAPHFDDPVPTEYGAPVPARFKWVPLLPFWKRALSRPNLLLELLLIRVGYSIYQQTRLVAAGSRATAEEHGSQIHAIEQALFIDIEHWANHATAKLPWLEEFLNFYYTSFHFVVPLTVLAVLYIRRPVDFRWARGALGFATVLALLGFWLYPLAPPRLMPDLGFIDTVHGVQDFSQPDYGTLTAVTNQYAAMPSLHFGWSLWCGVVIAILAPKGWMKLLGLLHPAFTLCAIVGTGNHWILDAVGGAAVVGAGFGLVYVLAGPRPKSSAAQETDPGTAKPPTPPEPEASDPDGSHASGGDDASGVPHAADGDHDRDKAEALSSAKPTPRQG
ncbi:Polyprenol-phosphate-mannose-dependent alpha-(1-2)-phosphatidylinositol mannoside mannosyltransferase [Streptomyces sp. YIM 130001]|nr:Polyprenol-phosphate-mannose-dependent alpha-(1-2)-phosphatidylinositol mannoside mannosyltransferase [Streptomyces sp. YIM 130001]